MATCERYSEDLEGMDGWMGFPGTIWMDIFILSKRAPRGTGTGTRGVLPIPRPVKPNGEGFTQELPWG
jgi:hypothetical protein